MTWRGVEDPYPNLDELIDAYFADQRILAASTDRLLREHRPIPQSPLPGYDGRLFDWLTEMLNRSAEQPQVPLSTSPRLARR